MAKTAALLVFYNNINKMGDDDGILYYKFCYKKQRFVWLTECFLLIVLASGSMANSSFNYPDWCSPPAASSSSSSSWTRPFLVALLADPHMGAERCSPEGLDCEALVRTAAAHVERLQPDLILWAGDLLQDRQDEESYERLKSILEDMSHSGSSDHTIPYHVIPGNTDVGSLPTLERLDAFREQWQLPYYWYTVEYYNTLFVMLDSNILRNRDNDEVDEDIVELAWEELGWLDATLQASSTGVFTHAIAIAHHPLAVQELGEATSRENTPRQVRLDLASIYQQHLDTVKLVLSGHLHYAGRIGGQTPLQQFVSYPATTFILGEEPRGPPGFALLKVDGNRLDEQFYGYNDMPFNRPESEKPGFEITFPSGEKNLVVDSQICITWTSQSMTNYVRLQYSLDDGQNWSLIAEQVPNVGVFPWTIPLLPSSSTHQQAAQFLVRISSVNNQSIASVSQEPSQIIVVENNDDTGEDEEDSPTSSTDGDTDNTAQDVDTNNTAQDGDTNNTAQAWSSSQGKFPTPVKADLIAIVAVVRIF